MLSSNDRSAIRRRLREIDAEGERLVSELRDVEWDIDTGALTGLFGNESELEAAEQRAGELRDELIRLGTDRRTVIAPLKKDDLQREAAHRQALHQDGLKRHEPTGASTGRVRKHRRKGLLATFSGFANRRTRRAS